MVRLAFAAKRVLVATKAVCWRTTEHGRRGFLIDCRATHAVDADKGVAIDMSAYGWSLHKAFTKNLQYLIVDTDHIPNLDRFGSKHRAIASSDTQKATNLGTTILDKVIETKKAGHPIQIISRDYLEGCIATDSFR